MPKSTKADQFPLRITLNLDHETKWYLDDVMSAFQRSVPRRNERLTTNSLIRALLKPLLVDRIISRIDPKACINEAAFHAEIEKLFR